MFGLPLSAVVCGRTRVSFVLFAIACVEWCPAHIVLCFSSSYVHRVAGFFNCPILIASSVFSNVYLAIFLASNKGKL